MCTAAPSDMDGYLGAVSWSVYAPTDVRFAFNNSVHALADPVCLRVQKLHPDLFDFLRTIRTGVVFPGEVVTIMDAEGGPVLSFDTAPIEITSRRLLFSRRHHSQDPRSLRTPYGPRDWSFDSTKYAETTQLVFPMPPAMVREEPEKCLIVLSRTGITGKEIVVEYRCIPKYSEKRVQLTVVATGMPLAVARECESFMWCTKCWAENRPKWSGRQGIGISYYCLCPCPAPPRPR
jgi:hypothetical protein